MYTDAVVKYRCKVKWMAFIDIDEFIVPEKYGSTLINEIENITQKINPGGISIGGIGINWLVYGSSHHIKRPDGLVIENYMFRGNDNIVINRTIKTIADPRRIIQCDIHRPIYIDNYVNIDENGEIITDSTICNSHYKLRINHYASKSKEEAKERMKKGFGGSRSVHMPHDYNDCFDDIMVPYLDKLKERIYCNY